MNTHEAQVVEDRKEETRPQHVMTLEEYRAHYVREQRLRYQKMKEEHERVGQRSQVSPVAVSNSSGTEESLPQRLAPNTEGGQLRAVQGNMARYFDYHEWMMGRVRVVIRAVLASLLIFRSAEISNVLIMLGICALWSFMKTLLSSFHVERAQANGGRGSFPVDHLTNMSRTVPRRTEHVSRARRGYYIVCRCFTSFLLSLSPTYSVEKLDAELAADGIVGIQRR
ncbi:hypothetical protein ERJ75_000349300 [Trypanosoma vivax]|uniref:Transmembrane protein n=1 Tax=Trypanosoma vivax (strain Y486) TaxID=1055687 RepID=G0TVD5_TRYVY|nr:hypothetical protein TRVL_04419 [Trypanosoma vivax]KAH8617652.1 hypothetical protein ERJ75_000349300 [Trypanosoma vivax]CCC47901.1 conserved hypothetical protein [Trypanosoma vivax Y486]